MTRDKSVSEAADKHKFQWFNPVRHEPPYNIFEAEKHFIDGARWADANPLPCAKCQALERKLEIAKAALKRANAEMLIVLENNRSFGTLSPIAIQAALKEIEG